MTSVILSTLILLRAMLLPPARIPGERSGESDQAPSGNHLKLAFLRRTGGFLFGTYIPK